MSDLISRQAAIELMCRALHYRYEEGYAVSNMMALPSAQPEQRWIPCSEPPEDEKNVFIAHGAKDFMTCCIGHYDRDNGLWYEDRNWFASPIFDGAFWCEIPLIPEAEG